MSLIFYLIDSFQINWTHINFNQLYKVCYKEHIVRISLAKKILTKNILLAFLVSYVELGQLQWRCLLNAY